MGLRPMITEARADLTCWFPSQTSSLTHGRMFVMMTDSWTDGSKAWQKSRTLWAAAARTSASQSLSRLWKGRTATTTMYFMWTWTKEKKTKTLFNTPGMRGQGPSWWFPCPRLSVAQWTCLRPCNAPSRTCPRRIAARWAWPAAPRLPSVAMKRWRRRPPRPRGEPSPAGEGWPNISVIEKEKAG